MTRQQFRLLVIANQLLLFGGYLVRDMTDVYLPPELQAFLVGDVSVLDADSSSSFDQFSYALWRVIDVLTLLSAVGLCLGRGWGRTLYLACFVVSLFTGLLNPFYVSTNWAGLVFSLFGMTEGMILALAYFSHLRRIFKDREEAGIEESETSAGPNAD